MMDADFSHHPDHLPAMLREAERYDVVIGSRYTSGGRVEGWNLWRTVLSMGGNLYCRAITRMPVLDCTSGFNVIRVDLLRKIDFSELGLSAYAFQIGLKYHLWKLGASFKEVPIVFKDRSEGDSKMTGHIIWEGILAPWKIVFQYQAPQPGPK